MPPAPEQRGFMVEQAVSASPEPAEEVHPPITAGQVGAAVIGNALEFYDFTVYTVFAVDIGHAFFPNHTGDIGLLLALATFGAGFILRPLGAVVIGLLADRVGRRPAMLLSFALMGVAIVGLASTPSFAQIGVAAPIIVVLLRLIQGFALGGEVGPAMAFLIEAAPEKSRGLVGSWQSASQSVSSLVGGLVGVAVAAILTPAMVELYGWRIAFWIGAAVLPVGLIIRRALPETLHRPEPKSSAQPERGGALAHWPIFVLGLMVIMCFTTSTYVRLYMTTYARTSLHMASGAAFGASLVNGAVGVVFTLAGGWLSDRFGRKAAMIWPLGIYLLVTYPAFAYLVAHPQPWVLWGVTGLVSALSSLSTGAALIWLTEGLRKDSRSAGMGTLYAVAVAVFGGTTQPLLLWLIDVTGQPMAPAFYLMFTTAIGLMAMALMKETAPGHLSPSRLEPDAA
jgi:MFS transporter, MHS family, citrate/tricarballylate:H+ symporter